MKTELKEMNEERTIRGYAIISKGVTPTVLDNDSWLMPSQTTNEKYLVRNTGFGFTCECPDFLYRHSDCKHIHAIRFWLNLKEKIRQKETIEVQEELANRCVYCYSEDIIKKDKRQTKFGIKQRFLCKNCGRKFVSDPVKKVKGNGKIVSLVLDLYFKGISLRKIQDHLNQFYNLKISHVALYKWISKFMGIMTQYTDRIQPQLSDTWHVDEQMIKVKGDWMWNYNILDANTRFLIANQVTKERSVNETREVFKQAKKITEDRPKTIITDGLWSYNKAISKEMHSHRIPKVKHVRLESIRAKVQNNKIERFHNTFRERDKTLRGFKKETTPIISGFRTYYNFVRPNQALNGKTPSDMADIDLGINKNDNRWMELLKKSINNTPIEQKPREIRKIINHSSQPKFILKVFDGNGNELNPKELGMKDKFYDETTANKFVDFYKMLYPKYGYKIGINNDFPIN
jgi:putative transposase